MTHHYKADEDQRKIRIIALETARSLAAKEYANRKQRLAAAEELLSYNVFTAVQICEWLGLATWSLEGHGSAPSWGIRTLQPEQFDMAIDLAKEGLAGEKPKTLIYKAYSENGMSFDQIGGLLGVHKNVIRRIVRRIEGEPWS